MQSRKERKARREGKRRRGGGQAGSEERDRFNIMDSQPSAAQGRSVAIGFQTFLSCGILASNIILVETPYISILFINFRERERKEE